jgi:RNA polymerase sigma factor for flagellar operon FliA
VDAEHLYTQFRPVIEQAIDVVCRRHALSAADADDFSSAVHLHLIDNEFRVLRKFEHRSSFRTFIIAVITHKYQDWRNARWGKWRPSAEAKRRGGVALHLERLLLRDGLSFDQAHETLRTNFQVRESRQELEAIAATLPRRHGRQFVHEDELADQAAPQGAADESIRAREAAEGARIASAALARALCMLPSQDRLVLRMRFEDGFTVTQIADVLRLEAKPLYRRIDRLLTQLRARLEQVGVNAITAAELFEAGAFDRFGEDTSVIDATESGSTS